MVCGSHRAPQSQAREPSTNPPRASPMRRPGACSKHIAPRQQQPRLGQPRETPLAISQSLQSPPFLLALRYRDVAIDRQARKFLRAATGLRPFNLNPINGLALPNPQHDARIVIRKIAPAPDLEPRPCQITGFVFDLRADGIDVRFFANQPNAQPMILLARQVV